MHDATAPAKPTGVTDRLARLHARSPCRTAAGAARAARGGTGNQATATATPIAASCRVALQRGRRPVPPSIGHRRDRPIVIPHRPLRDRTSVHRRQRKSPRPRARPGSAQAGPGLGDRRGQVSATGAVTSRPHATGCIRTVRLPRTQPIDASSCIGNRGGLPVAGADGRAGDPDRLMHPVASETGVACSWLARIGGLAAWTGRRAGDPRRAAARTGRRPGLVGDLDRSAAHSGWRPAAPATRL